LYDPEALDPEDEDYSYHKVLAEDMLEALPAVTGKRAFIFSTSGGGEIQTHAAPKKLLMNRGFSIVGDFSCKGWTTWGL
jgi:hypothetical protein